MTSIAALPTLMPHLSEFLRDWIDQQRRSANVPGAQVAVRLGNDLLFSYASGVASTATGEALTPGHAFRIASHSKTFTATAIMQLVEAGTLRLDDTVARWVPELTDSPIADVTLREALGHQSGTLRDGRDASFWQLRRAFPDRDELIAELRAGERVFGANTHFHYSNLAYSVLGLVIEAATGRTYADVSLDLVAPLRDWVSEPLVLGPELGVGEAAPAASGHGIPAAERTGIGSSVPPVIAPVDTRAQAAATGFWGNAESVSAWIAAHAPGTGVLLSDASKRLMQRRESSITVGGATRHYGLGFIIQDVAGVPVIGHSGGFPGHISLTIGDPATGLTVSALTNRIDGPAGALATGVFGVLQKVLAAVTDEAADIVLPDIAGRYLSIWGDDGFVPLPGLVLRMSAGDADPAARAMVLRQTDGVLRADAADGFGDAGEIAYVHRTSDGSVEAVTTTGITAWRPEVYATIVDAMHAGEC